VWRGLGDIAIVGRGFGALGCSTPRYMSIKFKKLTWKFKKKNWNFGISNIPGNVLSVKKTKKFLCIEKNCLDGFLFGLYFLRHGYVSWYFFTKLHTGVD
jgi:hypothetical protein